MTRPAVFRNAHLSYSRLALFEQCPRAFRFRYVDKVPDAPGFELKFGKAVHATLELLVGEHLDAEGVGPLDVDRALSLFDEAWTKEGLTGVEAYSDGVAMLRQFVAGEGIVDWRDVLAVEKTFELTIGRFKVVGAMDRVDRDGEEGLLIRDYKSNRALFDRQQLDTSLQASLYAIAARRIWPWAKSVRVTFDMLRHGVRQHATRTPDQLGAVLRYVENLGEQTEAAGSFPARPSTLCSWCSYRERCDTYRGAVTKRFSSVKGTTPDTLEEIAREREEIATTARLAYARQKELDGVLKKHLVHAGELVLGGHRYSTERTRAIDYPLDRVSVVLADALKRTPEDVRVEIGAVDKDRLNALVRDATKVLPKSDGHILKAELEACADVTYTPRLAVREVRS